MFNAYCFLLFLKGVVAKHWETMGSMGGQAQGYLAHKKPPSSRDLQ